MLEVVWEMAFLPDGRLLVTERAGRVRLVTPDGELQDEPWAAPDNVFHSGGGGVMGFALHPRFPEEPWVYVMYTLDTPDGEVPDDNPWPGNPVWAYGLRNAHGHALRRGSRPPGPGPDPYRGGRPQLRMAAGAGSGRNGRLRGPSSRVDPRSAPRGPDVLQSGGRGRGGPIFAATSSSAPFAPRR